MELTGKCKENFENWYLNNPVHTYHSGESPVMISFNEFNKIDVRCQWGVYVDFFDSVELHLCATPVLPTPIYGYSMSVNVDHDYRIFKTRSEAQNAVIQKANEIYNKSETPQ